MTYPRLATPMDAAPSAPIVDAYTVIPPTVRLLIVEIAAKARRLEVMASGPATPTPQFDVACEALLQVERQARQARELLMAAPR